MSLTIDEVKQIAHLARLGIDEKDIDTYASDLSNMLKLMTQMGPAQRHSIWSCVPPANIIPAAQL